MNNGIFLNELNSYLNMSGNPSLGVEPWRKNRRCSQAMPGTDGRSQCWYKDGWLSTRKGKEINK